MVRGYALGGGLVTALRADLRIASENAQLGIPAVRLGLGYSFENTQALVDVVGLANASEMLLTGRRFDAHEALRMGLVNRVVPDEELESTVRELAETIAENAPLALKLVKASVRETMKAAGDRDEARHRAARRGVLRQCGLRGRPPRLHGKANARVHGPLSRRRSTRPRMPGGAGASPRSPSATRDLTVRGGTANRIATSGRPVRSDDGWLVVLSREVGDIADRR